MSTVTKVQLSNSTPPGMITIDGVGNSGSTKGTITCEGTVGGESTNVQIVLKSSNKLTNAQINARQDGCTAVTPRGTSIYIILTLGQTDAVDWTVSCRVDGEGSGVVFTSGTGGGLAVKSKKSAQYG